jgi:hypothetical protein
MPNFAATDGGDYNEAPRAFASIAPESTQQSSRLSQLTRPADDGAIKTLGGSLLLGVPDLLDTVASSLPGAGSILGIERGQINNKMLAAIDMPGLTNFYNNHRDAIETTSGIYGIIGAELITRKAGAALAPMVAGLKTLPFARRIATLDLQYARAMETVRAVDTSLAQKGIIGAEQYTAAALVPIATWGKDGFTTSMQMVGRGQIAQKAKGLAFAKGALQGAKVEAVIATTMNENSFLFSEDTSQNLLWMSLGIALPGAFSAQESIHAMKKFVNSDVTNRMRAEALDPTGLERASLNPFNKGLKQKAEESYLGSLQGSLTDQVTTLAVEAKAAANGADASTVARMSTQRMGLAYETMEKVIGKGILGEGRASMKDGPVGLAIRNALSRDEGAFLNTEMLGVIPEAKTAGVWAMEVDEKLTSRLKSIQDELDQDFYSPTKMPDGMRVNLLKERKQLRWMKGLTPGGIVDGERVTLSQMETYDNWIEPEVQSKLFGDKLLFESVEPNRGPTHGLAIDENLDLILPKGKSIDKLDLFDSLRMYRAADKLVSHLAQKAGTDSKFTLLVPNKPNWFQLETAEELLKRTDGHANVVWPAGMTRESAQVEALAQKVEAIVKQGGVKAEDIHKLRVMYNLPKLSSYEMGVLGTEAHPVDILLRGAVANGGAETLRSSSLAEIKNAISEARKVGDLYSTAATQIDTISGTSFKFLQDTKGLPVKPLMTYNRPFKPHEWVKDNLSERLAIKKVQTVNTMINDQAGPLTKAVTGSLLGSADMQLTGRVSSLADIQLQSALPGAVKMTPSSGVGSFVNDLTSTEWRARDNPILQAATRLREGVDRMSLSALKTDTEAAMGDTISLLNGPRNQASRILVDNFHSFRPGWDLEEKVLTTQVNGKNLHQFVLEDTVANRAAFKRQFGREMGKGELLKTPQGTTVVLDDLAFDVQTRFNSLTDKNRIEKNTILRAQGLPEIRKKSWYVPSPSVEGKFIGFTFDASDNIVPGGTIIANTQDEYNRILSKMRADQQSVINSVGNEFRSREQIKEFADIWDKAQMEMLNAGTTAVSGGKTNRGALTGAYAAARRFDESMISMRDSYLSHGGDVLTTLMKDQINAAKMRANIGAPAAPNKVGGIQFGKPSTIHDYWLDAIYGRARLASPGSPTGKIYNALESGVNGLLRSAQPTASQAWHGMTDWIRNSNPFSQSKEDVKVFTQLSEKLGEFMPFKEAAELAERRGAAKMPVELAHLTGKVNQFTAAWVLRMFESAHAVMNLSGILNAMPSVTRHLSLQAGESIDDFAQRIGHSADIFTTPSGKSTGALSMGKLAQRGFKRAWNRTSDADYTRLANKGMLSQEVSEFQRAFNSVESKTDMQRFFGGDPTSKNRFMQKGAVGWVSILSDKSEDFTRSWAHFVGDDLGRQLGIPAGDSLDNFAHDVANKMIANYSPANRPAVFQGAIGAPIGLFQSFIFNYYQRLFRYIETGDTKSLAVQYAVQGTLFGAGSVPGFKEANSLFFAATNGETSPYDGVYAGFNESAGDILMNGTLSNLPKLFGAEALDLYSRGDTSVRLPGFNMPPAYSVLAKLKAGIGEAIDMFSNDNPHLSVQQVGEVLSNALPNRPLAGLTEVLLAGGQDTDSYGQLVTETRGWLDSTYRVMGLRSMQASKELNAFYANKQAQEIETQQRDILNRSTRSAIRAGDESALPAIFAKYVENGGDPAHIRRWYKSAHEAATETRGTRQLDKAFSSENVSQIDRLLDAEVSLADDAETEDPTDYLSVADPMDSPQPLATETGDSLAYGMMDGNVPGEAPY